MTGTNQRRPYIGFYKAYIHTYGIWLAHNHGHAGSHRVTLAMRRATHGMFCGGSLCRSIQRRKYGARGWPNHNSSNIIRPSSGPRWVSQLVCHTRIHCGAGVPPVNPEKQVLCTLLAGPQNQQSPLLPESICQPWTLVAASIHGRRRCLGSSVHHDCMGSAAAGTGGLLSVLAVCSVICMYKALNRENKVCCSPANIFYSKLH